MQDVAMERWQGKDPSLSTRKSCLSAITVLERTIWIQSCRELWPSFFSVHISLWPLKYTGLGFQMRQPFGKRQKSVSAEKGFTFVLHISTPRFFYSSWHWYTCQQNEWLSSGGCCSCSAMELWELRRKKSLSQTLHVIADRLAVLRGWGKLHAERKPYILVLKRMKIVNHKAFQYKKIKHSWG